MLRMNKNKKGQAGFVITVELLLIVVILVMGLVTGWTKLRDASLAELADTASAVGSIDQSYQVYGTNWNAGAGSPIASHVGFQYDDEIDNFGNSVVGGDAVDLIYVTPVATSDSNGLFETNLY